MTATQKTAAPRPGILVRISRAARRDSVWYSCTAFGAVLAGLLSFAIGHAAHTWYDENYSLIVCQRPFREMMHLIAVDVHPPLYYLFLRGWCALFGWTTAAERGLGAVFLALAVYAMAHAFGHAVGRGRAILVLPFLVLSPYAIRYGFEIRMYSLLMLEVALSTYALVRAIHGPCDGGLWHRRKWWFVYALSVVAGMYTQYLVLTVFVAQALLLLIRTVRAGWEGKGRDWFWVTCYAGGVVCYLPWVPVTLAQMGNPSFAAKGPMGPAAAFETVVIQLTGTVPEAIGTLAGFAIGAVMAVWIATFVREEGLAPSAQQRLFSQVAAQPEAGGQWRTSRRTTWLPLCVLAWMVVVPYLGLMLVSWVREIDGVGYYFTRYALPMTLYFSGFLGLACTDAALGDEDWREPVAPRPDDATAGDSGGRGGSFGVDRRNPNRVQAEHYRSFVRNHLGALCWVMSLCLVLGGTATVAVYKNTGTAYAKDIGSNYGDVVASMTQCSDSHPVVTGNMYMYVNYWDVFSSCPAYYFIYPSLYDAHRADDEPPDYGGYALLRGSGRQLRSVDELVDKGVTEFTYLSQTGPISSSDYMVVSRLQLPSYGMLYRCKSRS